MSPESPTHSLLTRLMRVFFYLLYQPMSWSYDLVAWIVSWGRWKDWVMMTCPYLKGPYILELGHGPGHLQVALHGKSIYLFGIDASQQMGRQAKQRISKSGNYHQLACGYAQKLPFLDSSFDQIVSTFPTDYIYAQETLEEIHRTLKVGGKLVVLPTAWITGKRLIDRGTANLFRVTGKASAWDPKWLVPFQKAGFQPEVEMITRKSWSLVIILAHKAN